MFTPAPRRLLGSRFQALSLLLVAGLVLCVVPTWAQDSPGPVVSMQTNHGEIVIQLQADKAPLTVANFLEYVNSGFYEGTVFHRVVPEFMIQGGGFTEDLKKKPVGDPVKNEAENGLSNARGTIAMARTRDPHSATAQFFINHGENGDFLDQGNTGGDGWGYAVFGYVIEGMDVVDEIATVETGKRIEVPNMPVPVEPVIIQKVTVRE